MTQQRVDDDGKILVDSLDEVPHFASDAECAAFWDAHSPSDEYLRKERLSADDARVKRLDALLRGQRVS